MYIASIQRKGAAVKMETAIRKIHAFYEGKPDAPLYQKEFGYYCLDTWIAQGYLKPRQDVADYDAYLREVFSFDEPATYFVGGLGGCEAEMFPWFEEVVLEDRGKYELVRDFAGRHVLYFKGRRNGFMPEYVDHPVKDFYTWEHDVKWRLDPHTPGRAEQTQDQLEHAAALSARGHIIIQYAVGGYMYLRSLIGPEALLYVLYDNPALIHDCMKTWLELADAVTARHQQRVPIDELLLDEDICYNHGPLISPAMMQEFLFPYYQQLLENMRRRAAGSGHTLHFELATDGDCRGIIDLYGNLGCDVMNPFEVASGCDVVAIGQAHPALRLSGGIDKRVLAAGKEDIDRHLDRILPAMRRRGGYIPTCDHGVPEEVSFENYMHYRRRMLEYAK